MFTLSRNRFILIWLVGGLLVVLVRALAVVDLGYDLTVQLQAAQNLLAGHGLSIHNLGGQDDLAQPARLITLTHFPLAYPVMAAALMSLGLALTGAVQVAGAIATIFGWWGWAVLAYAFFREFLNRSSFWSWAAIIVAFSSPLLLTPPWGGTDIFLWAFLPWVLYWLGQGATRSSGGWWFDWAAGVGCGLAFLFRYAGAFLLVYAALVILCQTRFAWKPLFRRGAILASGALPLIAVQIYINKFVAGPAQNAAAVDIGHGLTPYLKTFAASFWMLPAANFSYAWWMPSRLLNLVAQPVGTLLGPIGPHGSWLMAVPLIAVIFIAPPVMLWAGNWKFPADVRTVAVGLFWFLPLFLWACTIVGVSNPLMGDYSFVADFRYYTPLIPLSVLVAIALASKTSVAENAIRKMVRLASGAYALAYIALAVVGVLLLITPMSLGNGKRQKLLGTSHLYRWPGSGVEYDFSATRRRALDLLRQNPDAILITDQPQWFYAEPKIDRSRIHRFGDLKSTYVNGPAEIFVVSWDAPGGRDDDFYWRLVSGPPRRSDELTGLDNFHLVDRFPAEQMKILETEVPASKRVGLKAAGDNGAVAATPPN